MLPEGTRGQGFKDSSEMLKNYKEQILLAGDSGLIEKGVLDRLKKDKPESERILKALIKSLENNPLNP